MRTLRRRRRTVAILAVLLTGAAVAVAVFLVRPGGSGRAVSPPHLRRRLTLARTDRVPVCNVVASLSGPTPAYAGPGARAAASQVPGNLAGQAVGLPVIDQVGPWLEVRVGGRPNGQTVWLAASSVRELADPYRIVVDLAHQRLFLYRAGRVLLSAPAAVGSPASPTPLGNYFVTLLAQAPSPGYGPFVVVTSAAAGGLTDWEVGSQPVIAITGPLQWQGAIGSPNAAVTTGGVALTAQDLAQLRPVPLGTPVDVLASWNPPPPPSPRPRHHPGTPSTVPGRRPAAEPVAPVAPFPLGLGCTVAPSR